MKNYIFSKIFLNFLCWLFIGFGFLFIPVFAEGMGFTCYTLPINGIGSFISESFVWATLLGYLLMSAILLVLIKVLIRLRTFWPTAEKRWPGIPDKDASEMFFSEWLSQINSIANLAMVALVLYGIDKSIGNKVFTAPILPPESLIKVSLSFYAIGAILAYAFTPTPAPKIEETKQPA
jgi:hypothetical protein